MKTHTLSYQLSSWLPVVFLCALIFYISSYPTAVTTSVHWEDFSLKKLAHLLWSAGLAILTFRALKRDGMNSKNACISAIVFVFFYGCSDELHQRFVTGRESRFRDVLIDTSGASLAILGVWNLLPKTPTKLKRWVAKLDLL